MWPAICRIFESAFSNQAATGGFIGSTFMLAMQNGVRRGLFSNEAGMGSSPLSLLQPGRIIQFSKP
ncbi:MAG: sodium:alanine symporter family protein [Akkermansia sp.]|nr:sodium:alanine symporter family protein [Akkermansia sp.]